MEYFYLQFFKYIEKDLSLYYTNNFWIKPVYLTTSTKKLLRYLEKAPAGRRFNGHPHLARPRKNGSGLSR